MGGETHKEEEKKDAVLRLSSHSDEEIVVPDEKEFED